MGLKPYIDGVDTSTSRLNNGPLYVRYNLKSGGLQAARDLKFKCRRNEQGADS